ncbi:MAG TPA: AAA family ATPase [Chitinophagales bacterium]|nr:AAA family ATPase [Chitinophagales bacterium]
MRIKRVELKYFKRFTDLTISDIPETSKLVLLIGSNGSGKSSLFDAFDWLHKSFEEIDSSYYLKTENKNTLPKVKIELSNGQIREKPVSEKGSISLYNWNSYPDFWGRSSTRILPRLTNEADLSKISLNSDGPYSYIDNDTRFINDVFQYIQQINNALREPVFKGQVADTLKIFKDFIEPLNTSLLRIFGGDEKTTIQIAEFKDATPTTTPQLIFKKGDSKINYDLLSHGEKQVIILLINFIVRQEYYKDSIIFIDEMDCHLNTVLQSTLLDEIVNRWIPDDAQLWTASHALGFIDYARKSHSASIIDFDLLNFDIKQEIVPLSKDRLDVYEIAIPKATIASILKGYKLVIVENKNDEHYNSALGQDGYLFLPANNNREVFLTVKGDKVNLGLRDRDYLRTDEIEKLRALLPNLKILQFYTFENYIYHPDNIEELKLERFSREEYITEITSQKNDKLLDIAGEIGTARSHYIEFKDGIKNDEEIKPIITALKSDTFEDFYPFFNMKKHFNRQYLSQFNLSVSDLTKTKWFKQQVLAVLNS